MKLEKQTKEHFMRVKRMGTILFSLAFFFSLLAYLLPTDESVFWLSTSNKEGVYVLSAFFCFLGLYCWGGVWRGKNFI